MRHESSWTDGQEFRRVLPPISEDGSGRLDPTTGRGGVSRPAARISCGGKGGGPFGSMRGLSLWTPEPGRGRGRASRRELCPVNREWPWSGEGLVRIWRPSRRESGGRACAVYRECIVETAAGGRREFGCMEDCEIGPSYFGLSGVW